MEPVGHIEPLSAIIRLGGAYGDPFEWSAVLRYDEPDQVEVMAVCGVKLTRRHWLQVERVLYASGVRRMWFWRTHHQKSRIYTLKNRTARPSALSSSAPCP